MEPFTRFYPDDDDPWGGRLAVRREKTPVGAGSALLLSPCPSNSGSRAMLMDEGRGADRHQHRSATGAAGKGERDCGDSPVMIRA
jgi:hypothetical protein